MNSNWSFGLIYRICFSDDHRLNDNFLLFLLEGVSDSYYTTIPVQGSGTFAVEAVFHSAVPKSYGKVGLIL